MKAPIQPRRTAGFGLGMLVFVAGFLAGCGPAESGGRTQSEVESKIAWLTDYPAALQLAQSSNRLVVIDFFATWCGPCKLMDQTTFTDEAVQARLAGFIPLKIDVDRQQQLAARYGIESLPTTLVADAQGKPLATGIGYLTAKDYLAVLDAAKAGSSKSALTK